MTFERGAHVVVVIFGGIRQRARVWDDLGAGVLICSEDEYQQAIAEDKEPLYAGFPRQDVLADGDNRDEIESASDARRDAHT